MELTIEKALQQGVAAHNSGNLQEAEHVYQAILMLLLKITSSKVLNRQSKRLNREDLTLED